MRTDPQTRLVLLLGNATSRVQKESEGTIFQGIILQQSSALRLDV
jgi:hypothetical protein